MDGKIVSGDNLMYVALNLRYIVLSTTHGWNTVSDDLYLEV